MLGGIPDASLRRGVMDLRGSLMDLRGVVVAVGGTAVRCSCPFSSLFSATSRHPHVTVGDGLPTIQRVSPVGQLSGTVSRTPFCLL